MRTRPPFYRLWAPLTSGKGHPSGSSGDRFRQNSEAARKLYQSEICQNFKLVRNQPEF